MNKIVLGITGEIAGGKGTVASYLEKKHGAVAFKFSSALRDVAKRMHLEINRENLQKISTIFRENFDDNILSRVIYEDVKNSEKDLIVIDGVRRMSDIEYLKQLPGFRFVYVDTDMKKCYERIIQRGENEDENSKTFEDFQKDHEREAELQIKGLKEEADAVVDNNGSFDELYNQIEDILKELK
ncbi:AAA family ATPase [Patescibacteria group bacterium]